MISPAAARAPSASAASAPVKGPGTTIPRQGVSRSSSPCMGRLGEQPPLEGGEPPQGYVDADRARGTVRARGGGSRRTRAGPVHSRTGRRPDGPEQLGPYVGAHSGPYVVGQVLHAPRARIPGGPQEDLGGQERDARAFPARYPEHLVLGPDPQETAVARRDQGHVRAQRVHVAPAVVEGEEEAAGERGGGGRRADQGVQFGQPLPERGRAVESGERGRPRCCGPVRARRTAAARRRPAAPRARRRTPRPARAVGRCRAR